MAVNQDQRAALAWNVLVNCAHLKKKIRYKELSQSISLSHHRPLNLVLGEIFYYCLSNNLPPLSILAVNVKGIPGYGFTNYFEKSLEEGYEEVYNTDWNTVDNPFSFALNGTYKSELVKDLIKSSSLSGEVYSKVKVRGQAQAIFREALLEIYEAKCAICKISFIECLDACHINPWNECHDNDKINPQNGILLCANHHKLFDAGWITINSRYKVIINDDEPWQNEDDSISWDYNGNSIFLPKFDHHRPNKEFLKKHRAKFRE